jgi:hypothetical protein
MVGIGFITFSQHTQQQVWIETGVKISMTKKISTAVELNQRYDYAGIHRFFPQLTFDYKAAKWFRPSIDYRVVFTNEGDLSLVTTHRLNGNLQFRCAIKRLECGLRLRYQYRFDRISSAYDAEFDQAIRFKPSAQYNIKGIPLTPKLSAEFFYNPSNGAKGKQFNRIRLFSGIALDLPHKQQLSVGIYWDRSLNDVLKKRIMYGLSYGISLPSSGSKKKSSTKNLRDL